MSKKINVKKEFQKLVYVIEYTKDWIVEINFTNSHSDVEFYIYKKDIGVKMHMFTIENKKQSFNSIKYLIDANIKEYISLYSEEYIEI